MGLDITAYSHLSLSLAIVDGDYSREVDGHLVYPAPDCVDRLDGYSPGYYQETPETHRHEFRAGSYSGYSAWRAGLCRMALGYEPEAIWAQPDAHAGRPFVELINYSDCEGAIGPITSAKLANDFRQYLQQARESLEEYSFSKYKDWLQAFELASEDGFVQFH